MNAMDDMIVVLICARVSVWSGDSGRATLALAILHSTLLATEDSKTHWQTSLGYGAMSHSKALSLVRVRKLSTPVVLRAQLASVPITVEWLGNLVWWRTKGKEMSWSREIGTSHVRGKLVACR